jgi:predicted RNA-binding protein
VRFKHYGRNIELLIKKAIELQDPEEKEAAIIHIGRLMKGFSKHLEQGKILMIYHHQRHGDSIKKQLTIDLEKVKETQTSSNHL